MSYTILYRSMFVKMSNGKYIPMVECGSNNCYEPISGRGRMRRARGWYNFNLDFINYAQKFFTEDEIFTCLAEWKKGFEKQIENDMNSEDKWRQRMAATKDFGYYQSIRVCGKSLTKFNDIKSFFKSGIRNCVTFEEAVNKCGLCLYSYKNGEQKNFSFKNEDEMFAIINEKFGGNVKGLHFMYYAPNVSEYYNIKKAIRSFAKCGKTKRYKFECHVEGSDKVKYLSIKDNMFVLVDNIEDATWFDKTISNKVELWDLAHRWLGVKRMKMIFVNIKDCA